MDQYDSNAPRYWDWGDDFSRGQPERYIPSNPQESLGILLGFAQSSISGEELADMPNSNTMEQENTPQIIHMQAVKSRKAAGCQCTKNKCAKKYCSCHKAGVKCGPNCACKDCGNHRYVKFLRLKDFSDLWMHSSLYDNPIQTMK